MQTATLLLADPSALGMWVVSWARECGLYEVRKGISTNFQADPQGCAGGSTQRVDHQYQRRGTGPDFWRQPRAESPRTRDLLGLAEPLRQYSALALPPQSGLATGRGPVPRCLRKMTPPKGDRAREFHRGRLSLEDCPAPGNTSGLGEAPGCRARGILAWTTLLTQDPAVPPPQRTHPLPLPGLSAFGTPAVRFLRRGA